MISKQSAVIDRIVDGVTAVLLVGEEQREFVCPVEQLPVGSKEGQWLVVGIQEGSLVFAQLDAEKTEDMARQIRAKRALLLQRRRPRKH